MVFFFSLHFLSQFFICFFKIRQWDSYWHQQENCYLLNNPGQKTCHLSWTSFCSSLVLNSLCKPINLSVVVPVNIWQCTMLKVLAGMSLKASSVEKNFLIQIYMFLLDLFLFFLSVWFLVVFLTFSMCCAIFLFLNILVSSWKRLTK